MFQGKSFVVAIALVVVASGSSWAASGRGGGHHGGASGSGALGGSVARSFAGPAHTAAPSYAGSSYAGSSYARSSNATATYAGASRVGARRGGGYVFAAGAGAGAAIAPASYRIAHHIAHRQSPRGDIRSSPFHRSYGYGYAIPYDDAGPAGPYGYLVAAYAVPFVGSGYATSVNACSWYKRRYEETGLRKWRRRYEACLDGDDD